MCKIIFDETQWDQIERNAKKILMNSNDSSNNDYATIRHI